MSWLRTPCPKCTGNLFLERDADGRRKLPPEWTCLQCGWRQELQRLARKTKSPREQHMAP